MNDLLRHQLRLRAVEFAGAGFSSHRKLVGRPDSNSKPAPRHQALTTPAS
jgi:hypothetical protein